MRRDELSELHYITPIDNLPSIMRHGLVCNRRARSLAGTSIALERVQAMRASKRVPGGLTLHEYVNLYINARNPMLYLRLDLRDSICVLAVNCDVLDLPDVVVTDQNAVSKWVRFAGGTDALSIVDRDTTFAERWTHPGDQVREWRHKSQMCAEVLVPQRVAPRHILRAYVAGDASRRRVEALGIELPLAMHSRLFFGS
jgi:hypothetical protein